MRQGMDRKTESVIGLIFLGAMVTTLILAVATFEGTPTIILLVVSLVFLGVALFFLSGSGTSTGASGGGSGSQGQQQSVVLGNGKTVSQSSSGQEVYNVCPDCGERVPESATFCPECGARVGA